MTLKGLDFATLTLRDALDLAVLIEEEARERYDEFADQMDLHHTPEAAKFFRWMAKNEEKHRAELLARRVQLFGEAKTSVTREMLFDVEAPEYDEARAFMSRREALQAAFRAEKKAYTFFVQAMLYVQDPGVRSLFDELRHEEVQHQQLLLAELEASPPESALKTAGLEDEPVAQ